ncbi:hypothetical protein K8O93_01060 [Gordonia bronchialis]|uniref:hypothetical protein n=1 Tax=Gordonia bronchialis TaxID=2054 RepID=UPI001CBDF95B|nr:hypothetical protein [Gordonia bronchialis]UAK38423.1 hypothetical protein K8O93_01060 [Gordonia bronchialis]
MGYWSTDAEGHPFAETADELIWGDAPADELGIAFGRVMNTLRHHNGSWPSRDEVLAIGLDAIGKMDDPNAIPTYQVIGMRQAAEWFAEDIGRQPREAEMVAGLKFGLSGIFDDDGQVLPDWIEDHPYNPEAA